MFWLSEKKKNDLKFVQKDITLSKNAKVFSNWLKIGLKKHQMCSKRHKFIQSDLKFVQKDIQLSKKLPKICPKRHEIVQKRLKMCPTRQLIVQMDLKFD